MSVVSTTPGESVLYPRASSEAFSNFTFKDASVYSYFLLLSILELREKPSLPSVLGIEPGTH